MGPKRPINEIMDILATRKNKGGFRSLSNYHISRGNPNPNIKSHFHFYIVILIDKFYHMCNTFYDFNSF